MNADQLRRRLAAVRRKHLVCTVAGGVAQALTVSLAVMSVGLLMNLSQPMRILWAAGNIFVTGYVLWMQVVLPLRALPGEDGCALLVEQKMPELQNRLIASVQLTRAGMLSEYESPAMVSKLVGQTEVFVEAMDFAQVVDSRPARLRVLVAVVMLAAFVVLPENLPASRTFITKATTDTVPRIVITNPRRIEDLATSRATVLIEYEVHDDFGLQQVLLHHKTSGIEQVEALNLAGGTAASLSRQYEWRITGQVGAVIEYWLEARDVKHQSFQSGHYRLKIVSDDDKRAELMGRLDGYLDVINEAAEKQRELNENLESVISGKSK